MAHFFATGSGHGVLDHHHDLPAGTSLGARAFVGSVVELDSNNNPFQGSATLWISNIWPEIVNGAFVRVHYRVHVDWGSDLKYQVTMIFE